MRLHRESKAQKQAHDAFLSETHHKQSASQQLKASYLQYLQNQMSLNATRREDEDWRERKAPHFEMASTGYPVLGHLTESELVVKR